MTALSTAADNVRRRLRPEAVSANKSSIYGGYDEQLQGKVRDDIRDRAAFVLITGSFPTHLRRNYMAVLRAVTSYFTTPTSLDHKSGSFALNQPAIEDLDLQNHPMVRVTRSYIDKGFVIQQARQEIGRRPYTKVYLYRKDDVSDRVIVQVDGSVIQGWN